MAIIEDPRKKKQPQVLAKRPPGNPAGAVRGTTAGGLQITGSKSDVDKFMKPVYNTRQMNANRQAAIAPPPMPRTVRAASKPAPSKPEYLTRENSNLGWQARMARNKELDANYRAAMGNTSAENIASGRNATDLTRTGMTTQSNENIQGMREGGMNSRQALRQKFLGNQQEARFGQQNKVIQSQFDNSKTLAGIKNDYQIDSDERINRYNTEDRREKLAMKGFQEGNITDQSQARAMQDYGPAGVQGIQESPQPQRKSRFVKPEVGPDGRMVRPGMWVDEYNQTSSVDTSQLTDQEIIDFREFLESKRAKQALK